MKPIGKLAFRIADNGDYYGFVLCNGERFNLSPVKDLETLRESAKAVAEFYCFELESTDSTPPELTLEEKVAAWMAFDNPEALSVIDAILLIKELTAELEARTTERDEARRVAVEMAGRAVYHAGKRPEDGPNWVHCCTSCEAWMRGGLNLKFIHAPTCPVPTALEWTKS